ncbi:hypothetical protein [Clostridium butyricum]
MSDKHKLQKSFTEQAEANFKDKISMEIDEDLNEFKKDKKKVVEYLKEKENTITLGFAIRRYICERFSDVLFEDDDKYKCKIKDENGQVLEFEVDNFLKEDCSNEEYIKLMQVLIKKNEVKQRNKDKYIERQDLRRWLGHKMCDREMLLRKISFILEMDNEDINVFLNMVLSEKGYNFRKVDEIIYYFCHKNNLKSSKAEELLEKYRNMDDERRSDNSKHTEIIEDEVSRIETEEELLRYLKENRPNFIKISQSARNEFIKLIDNIRDMVKIIYPDNTKADGTISDSFLEKIFREGIEFDDDEISSSSAEENMSSARLKQSELKDILYQTLNRATIGKKLKGQMEVVRKDLIFLSFYKFSLLCSGYDEFEESEFGEESEAYSEMHMDNTVKNMMEFRDDTDKLLLKCGMGKLYIPNRFDNLILLSLCDENPFEYFSDVIKSSFPKN